MSQWVRVPTPAGEVLHVPTSGSLAAVKGEA